MADEQYAGRGQQNNTWLSERGSNLTCSVLLSPTFLSPERQFLLNQSISIAINDMLAQIIGPGAKIKWPNDIYVDHKKLGGILIENILRGSVFKHSIIGIGLNVNQTRFPEDVKNVTSIKQILHQDYDIQDVLQLLCCCIERRYLQLRGGKREAIERDYLNHLYRLNELHTFTVNGEVVSGVITGITKNGQLEVLIDQKLRTYNIKEIAFVQD
jgi:BirA family transcriptional regulator, biotin operon repressor / biotin---[acetyl-CoA-carboxylase] ligase